MDVDEAPGLVPELDVTGLASSIAFYATLGFDVAYRRPAEGFAYLTRPGAHVMLQTAEGPGRRFRTAALERPHGRGINFQLAVENVTEICDDVVAMGHEPLIALEERWYAVGDREAGNRQFVVADPDGYLWRLFENLGDRPI